MSALSTFFKGSDTQLGIFYPNHCMVCVFDDLVSAEQAASALRWNGFADGDVIAVPGEDLVELTHEEQRQHPLLGTFMKELSRLLGTEEPYTDHDLRLAQSGAGYVAVRCPTDARKERAWRILGSLRPVLARYYALGGIEHLAGEF
jgi:hypothetical protein